MTKVFNTQIEVKVGLETLWQALSKDLAVIIPKVIPDVVKDAKVVEGNGGLGTIFEFKFSDLSPVRYQKEKITVFDESSHEIGLDVIEGGHLNQGLSHYMISFQLSAIGELDTLVNVKISYEYEPIEEESTHPLKTSNATLSFLRCLEKYLMNDA